MISNRCKLAVKEELNKLGLHFVVADLGEVEVMEDITADQRELLQQGLQPFSISKSATNICPSFTMLIFLIRVYSVIVNNRFCFGSYHCQ